jgi:hypothetical protein
MTTRKQIDVRFVSELDDNPVTDWDVYLSVPETQPAKHWRHHQPTRFTARDLLSIALTSALLGVFCLAIWIVFWLL